MLSILLTVDEDSFGCAKAMESWLAENGFPKLAAAIDHQCTERQSHDFGNLDWNDMADWAEKSGDSEMATEYRLRGKLGGASYAIRDDVLRLFARECHVCEATDHEDGCELCGDRGWVEKNEQQLSEMEAMPQELLNAYGDKKRTLILKHKELV